MKRPEQAIQRAVFQHLKARGTPGVFAFHPANGGYRNKVEAAILKGQGVVPGVPDVIAIKEGRAYGLELKADKGALGLNQRLAHKKLTEAGATVATAWGLDAALSQLEAWGLLRRAA